MNRKLIGFLIIFLGIAIIVGIVYILFINQNLLRDTINRRTERRDNTKVENDANIKIQASQPVVTTPVKKANITIDKRIEPAPAIDAGEEMLVQMARSFAERFGSYSNQSNFNNISDLTIFMSSRMKRWADSYISRKRDENISNKIYYGITTKAVSDEVRSYNDSLGHASVLVKTRRREATGSTYNVSDFFDQDVLISFKKENGIWKVDAAFWQE